jgi:hypothetical protein
VYVERAVCKVYISNELSDTEPCDSPVDCWYAHAFYMSELAKHAICKRWDHYSVADIIDAHAKHTNMAELCEVLPDFKVGHASQHARERLRKSLVKLGFAKRKTSKQCSQADKKSKMLHTHTEI